MSYTTPPRVASTFFAIVIFFFGLNHLVIPEVILPEIPAYFPAPKFWVYLTGVAQILAAIAFIIHKQVRLAGYLLAAMMVVIAVLVHMNAVFYAGSLEERKLSAILMAKDFAIAAGAFYIGSKNE